MEIRKGVRSLGIVTVCYHGSGLWRDYCLWLSVSARSRLDTENYARVTVSSDVLTTVNIRFLLCNGALTLWLVIEHKVQRRNSTE